MSFAFGEKQDCNLLAQIALNHILDTLQPDAVGKAASMIFDRASQRLAFSKVYFSYHEAGEKLS